MDLTDLGISIQTLVITESDGVSRYNDAPRLALNRLPPELLLRNWRPGDRVRLRYSSGPRKVKEVLERLKVTGSRRGLWPVLELDGRIIWMQGVEVEPVPGIVVESRQSVPDGD